MNGNSGPAASPNAAGPIENATPRKLLTGKSNAAQAVVTPLPLRWARALIEGADGPIPAYGSPEWSALPDDSRVKVASCVQAAECWRTRQHQSEFIASGSRRAREIAEARRPRPGDHLGGPVEYEPGVASGE